MWIRPGKSLKNKINKYLYELGIINNEIITSISTFTLVLMLFNYDKEKPDFFNFKWRKFLWVKDKEVIKTSLLWTIQYLVDNKIIEVIELTTKPIAKTCVKQWNQLIIPRDGFTISDIPFEKIDCLFKLTISINHIFFKELPHNASMIVDLYEKMCEWRDEVFTIFKHKTEYIHFVYFATIFH